MQQDLVNLSADKAASAAMLQAAEERLQAALKDQEATATQLHAAQEAVQQHLVCWVHLACACHCCRHSSMHHQLMVP